MRQRLRNIEGLIEVDSRGRQPRTEVHLIAVARNGEALDRADVNARVALDAAFRLKLGFDIAIKTTLDFTRRLLGREAELYFNVELAEALHQIDMLHLLAWR